MTDASAGPRPGPGGTPGGLGQFIAGAAMTVAGGYLVLNQVTVTSGFWQLFGFSAFGLSLLPLFVGVGILFFNGRSLWGWALTGAGALIIFLGILTHLTIFFRPTTLFNTLLMLTLLAGGIGLVARSLKAQ